MTRSLTNSVLAALLACLSVSVAAVVGAADVELEPGAAQVSLRATGLTWQPKVEFESAVLTVSGPGDLVFREVFSAGEVIELKAVDPESGILADGQYAWELSFSPALSAELKSRLRATRETGDEAAVEELKSAGRLPSEMAPLSGSFRVEAGAVIVADLAETQPRAADRRVAPDVGSAAVSDQDAPAAAKDQVILDDLIVDGSICVGFDCVNGESFGFDTLRLKENNLRIKFQDTSNSASFPSNDWQLTANDTTNGGANRFSIDDIDGGRTPFTIEAGAPGNSLYVEDGGRIGFGTSTPAVELHVVNGDSPTLRLEQSGSSGFTPQTWDVAGNETNFFIRDATNGSRLPFRIRPSAPSNSIYIDTDGDVGFGTNSPAAGARLHVLAATGGGAVDSLLLENNAPARIKLKNTSITNSATEDQEWTLNSNGSLRITAGGDAPELTLDASGGLTILGTLTENSDVNAKENIEPVDPFDVLARVLELPVTRWNYTDNGSARHIGPMAQDFYNAFGLGADASKISPRDVASVALLAIQALASEMSHKDEQIEALTRQVRALEEKLAD